VITTRDNTLLHASKIVMPSSLLAAIQRSSVAINTGQHTLHLDFAAVKAQHKTVPEVWFPQSPGKTIDIITRKKHALICLSGV
jgi:hypothetical protein